MNKIAMSKGEKIALYLNALMLCLIGAATLYPFLNVVAVSISGGNFVSRGEVGIIPKGINLEAYIKIWENGYLINGYKNTIIVTLLTTVFGVFLTAITAYPLTKKRLKGRKQITLIIALTMWFGAGTVPTFLVMKNLHLLDKLIGLTLSQMLVAYNIIIMRSFFSTIPDSLEEAAKIDGCNDIGVLFKIILPLAKPVLATVSLWLAVAQWNNFFESMLYLQSKSNFTLQIILRDIVIANSATDYGMNADEGVLVQETIKYATIVAATLPILLIYPFIQKYFVKGVTLGAVKE